MNFSEIAQLSATVASALAAVLAWVAKLRWSKEYAAAKEEIIKSKGAQLTIKDEQIRMLRTLIESKDEAITARKAENSVLCRELDSLLELTPMKIKEYFLSVKSQLEAYNESLKNELQNTIAELQEKDRQLKCFRTHLDAQQEFSIETVQEDRRELQAKIAIMGAQAKQSNSILAKLEMVDKKDIPKVSKWVAAAAAASAVPIIGLPALASLLVGMLTRPLSLQLCWSD